MNAYRHFHNVIQPAEKNWIDKRRQQANLPNNDEINGLALSGGGIRSATVNLGVLQALEKHQQFKHIDIMSSVSGGGYIASSLTWFKSKLEQTFPFGSCRQDNQKQAGSIINWIRSHANFLTPGYGINKTSLITAIFTGTLINLLIILPVFILLVYEALLPLNNFFDNGLAHTFNTFTLLRYLGIATLYLTFLLIISTALSTGLSKHRTRTTENLRKAVSLSFSCTFLFLFLGCIPLIHTTVDQVTDKIAHASISVSALGVLITWISGRNVNKYSTTIMVNIGLFVCCLGFFVLIYHNALHWHNSESLYVYQLFMTLIGLSLVLAFVCNINLVSMHGYYRNRLRDAFMPFELPATDTYPEKKISTWQQAQNCYLKDIPISDAPYHIINCNIELTGSKKPKYATRAGDCFILSPLFCGATSTGYEKTSQYYNGNIDLASACAISGAAIATNTSKTRSKTLNFVLGMLNLRLGCWLPNPKFHQNGKPLIRPLWYFYMFRDIFGKGLNENQKHIHLSDGGHFENLGVYELVRRKCRTILSVDASADTHFAFASLAKMIELIRVDFGAKLSINVDDLLPGENGFSKKPYAIGKITYHDGSHGDFIYIKSCLIASLNADIYGYKQQNPDFPNQSTANQFFDEFQFEAYRELGFQLTHRLLTEHPEIFNKNNKKE